MVHPLIGSGIRRSDRLVLGKAAAQYKEGVNLYARKRNYRDAIAAFDRALEIDEKIPHVWNERGICYRTLGNYDEALKSFLRAVELAPGNVEILYELGETLEQMGVMQMNNRYLEAAVETFKMVVNRLPNNMESWNHIGICLKELGRPEESKFYLTGPGISNSGKRMYPSRGNVTSTCEGAIILN